MSWFLMCVEGMGVSRGWVRGWLRWSAHPLGGGVCRGHAQCPAFAPDTQFLLPALQKLQLGLFFFLSFCIFWSRICLSCAGTQLFLVPYSFFVLCCSRRSVSRCQHCSTADRSQACLRSARNVTHRGSHVAAAAQVSCPHMTV